jgi:hypothetical protein
MYLPRPSHRCHDFQYFREYFKFSTKKYNFRFKGYLAEMDMYGSGYGLADPGCRSGPGQKMPIQLVPDPDTEEEYLRVPDGNSKKSEGLKIIKI